MPWHLIPIGKMRPMRRSLREILRRGGGVDTACPVSTPAKSASQSSSMRINRLGSLRIVGKHEKKSLSAAPRKETWRVTWRPVSPVAGCPRTPGPSFLTLGTATRDELEHGQASNCGTVTLTRFEGVSSPRANIGTRTWKRVLPVAASLASLEGAKVCEKKWGKDGDGAPCAGIIGWQNNDWQEDGHLR